MDTTGGISNPTINPATNGNLAAHWRSGYFGNATPQRSQMWKHSRVITDQSPNDYYQTVRLVDDEQYTVGNPRIIGPTRMTASKQGIGMRAKRCSIEINFPQRDVSSTVLELQVMSIPTSDR